MTRGWWAREGGPGLHWLLGIPSSRLIELIRAEEGEKRLEDEDRAMLALLRRKASGSPFSTKDWLLFRRYRLAMELAGMLSAAPVECPDAVILWALRSRRKILRDAALGAVAEKITSGKRKWIARLSKSSSPHYRGAYELLVIRDALPLFPDSSALKAPRPYREFGILQRIARSQTRPELRALLRTLKKFRPTARSWLFAQGIAAHRTRGWASILRRLPRLGSSKIETLANSAGSQDFAALLEGYLEWNKKEAQHSGTRLGAIYEEKASALALAVLRTATKRDLALLRDCFQAVALTTSTQYFALTLIRLGDVREVLNIINAIERANHVVRYWFQIEMGHAIERRMTQLGDRLPKSLLRISSRRGFWEDSRSGESRFLRKDLLALEHPDNRALYLRVVAHAIIGLAGREDLDVLQKLTQHSYRMIARAAAIRLIRVAGDAGIKMLQAAVVASIERGNSEAFGLAVRDAEIQSFGLAELC